MTFIEALKCPGPKMNLLNIGACLFPSVLERNVGREKFKIRELSEAERSFDFLGERRHPGSLLGGNPGIWLGRN